LAQLANSTITFFKNQLKNVMVCIST